MKRLLLLICFLTSTAPSFSLFYESGQTQLAVLKIPLSVRTRGMGDAGVAAADDGGYASINPASLSSLKNDAIFLEHANFYQGMRAEYLSASMKWPLINIGVSLEYFDFGQAPVTTDGSDYDENNTFGAYTGIAMVTASRRIKNFELGVTVKGLRETVWYESSNGVAVDLGFLSSGPVRGMVLGASVLNVGLMGAMVNASYPLTQIFRAGGAYTHPLSERYALISALDLNLSNDQRATLPLGVEVKRNAFSVRTGYHLFNDTRDFSAGFGVDVANMRVDYSYVHYSDNLTSQGQPHFFSLFLSI